MADKSDNQTGYKKPPASHQFKPGQSGNPKGRPKGSKNFSAALNEELPKRMLISENGKRQTVAKVEALAKRLLEKALKGDLKAIALVISSSRLNESDQPEASLISNEDDLALIAAAMKEAKK